MDAKRFEHGGNIYQAIRSLDKKELLDFSANINPFGLPETVRKAILENLEQVIHYPDASAYELRKRICEFYGIHDRMLMLGNGATELLYLMCHVLKPQKVIIPVPSFLEYERAALSDGAIIDYFYLFEHDVFELDFTLLLERVEEDSLIFLGNPNNPTGNLLDIGKLKDFLEKTKDFNISVLVDESFIDFVQDEEQHTCRKLCLEYKNLFVLHSMTKFFAIPGLRLGFGIFQPWLVEKMQRLTDCWNVNSLAQAAGVAALLDNDYIKESKKSIVDLRQQLIGMLINLGDIRIFPSVANFLLLDVSAMKVTSAELCQLMAAKGVLIRDCYNYPGLDTRYIRIAVRSSEENKQFVEILKEVKEAI